jgi:hypothetical protein
MATCYPGALSTYINYEVEIMAHLAVLHFSFYLLYRATAEWSGRVPFMSHSRAYNSRELE